MKRVLHFFKFLFVYQCSQEGFRLVYRSMAAVKLSNIVDSAYCQFQPCFKQGQEVVGDGIIRRKFIVSQLMVV